MKKGLQKQDLSLEEREKLVEDNVNLVRHIVFEKFHIPYKDSDSAISDGFLGLLKAARTYDPAKGIKFTTYAGTCITNEILMSMRKEKKHRNVSSLEEPAYTGKDGSEIILGDLISSNSNNFYEVTELREEIEKTVNMILNHFQGSIRLTFLYYLSGMNQNEIAGILHISQSYISRIIKRVQNKLRKYININLDYKEVITMSMPNEKFYQFSFSSEEVCKFNQLFAKLIMNSDPKKIPTFKLLHSNNRIHLLLESEPESFAFIAQVIQEIDDFKLSFNSNNKNRSEEEEEQVGETQEVDSAVQEDVQEPDSANQGEEEEGYESEETNGGQEANLNQQKKACNFRKGTIAEKIFTFVMSQETFSVSNIAEKFPDCKNPMIQYVLSKAKKDNLITVTGKGVYTVNKQTS